MIEGGAQIIDSFAEPRLRSGLVDRLASSTPTVTLSRKEAQDRLSHLLPQERSRVRTLHSSAYWRAAQTMGQAL